MMGPQKMPRLLQSNHDGVEEAAARIEAGGVVAFPTETVYGLGASTFAVDGLKLIYEIKGRPSDNPLIAHVLDAVEARTLVSGWDLRCSRLAAKFWPGPLTMILNKAIDVPDEATAGLQTIAVRSPMHPVARALLYAFDGPISAPSANRSGHISPTTTEHVMGDFPEQDDLLVLEGGRANFGIESTVLDLTGEKPVIRRPGSITLESLSRVLGAVEVAQGIGQGVSPGTRLIHYAPKFQPCWCRPIGWNLFWPRLRSPPRCSPLRARGCRRRTLAFKCKPMRRRTRACCIQSCARLKFPD